MPQSSQTSAKNGKAAPPDYKGMERLVRAVRDLSMARDMTTIQNIVRSAAREMTGADGATFVLRDGNFCHYVDEDAISPLWKGKRFPLETCISGWVMLNRQTAVIENIYDDARIPADAYKPTFVQSLVMVPIRTAVPVGAIGNYWARQQRPGDEHVALLETLANTTAIAIENVQAYLKLEERVRQRLTEIENTSYKIDRLSLFDGLTGLYNRTGFSLLAEQELQRRNMREPIAMFIDMDGLKTVNAQMGNETGDSLITDAVRIIQGNLRETDLLGRVADDEFCVLALDQSYSALQTRMQNTIDAFNVGSAPFHLSLRMAPVTEGLSAKLATLFPRKEETLAKKSAPEKRKKSKSAVH
jgi:diguanylate cyclase (GGDEF)-like protein